MVVSRLLETAKLVRKGRLGSESRLAMLLEPRLSTLILTRFEKRADEDTDVSLFVDRSLQGKGALIVISLLNRYCAHFDILRYCG
jgi:hypothetical protein